MWEYQKKRKIRQILHSWPVLVVLFILFIFAVQAVWSVYKKQKVSALALESIKGEYAKLNDREKALSQSVEFLGTNEGQEAEIRRKFRVVREGEQIAVIVDDSQSASSVAVARMAALTNETESPSWGAIVWDKILRFLSVR